MSNYKVEIVSRYTPIDFKISIHDRQLQLMN